MIKQYIPLFLVFATAIVIAVAIVASSKLIGPQKPNDEKQSTYESGVKPYGTAKERISIKYYVVAMLFIIFDIEVIFVYPWAVKFKSLYSVYGSPVFITMLVFLVIFEIGYLYAYKKGGFNWD